MQDMSLVEAFARRRSTRDFGQTAVEKACIDRLIARAMGATSASGQRAAPSAHSVYPIKLYVSAGLVTDLSVGLYSCDTSALHLIRNVDTRAALHAAALGDQPWIENCAFVLTLCADLDHMRVQFADQPPLGQRGARYAYIEAGAIAQNLMLHATAEGLGTVLVAGFDDGQTGDVLQLTPPVAPLLHLCFGAL